MITSESWNWPSVTVSVRFCSCAWRCVQTVMIPVHYSRCHACFVPKLFTSFILFWVTSVNLVNSSAMNNYHFQLRNIYFWLCEPCGTEIVFLCSIIIIKKAFLELVIMLIKIFFFQIILYISCFYSMQNNTMYTITVSQTVIGNNIFKTSTEVLRIGASFLHVLCLKDLFAKWNPVQ